MSAPVAVGIPVGVIGAGKHGERYLRHIVEDVPELALKLVSRRDPAAGADQAARYGARYVADFRELAVSPEIEVVIAVAPPSLNRAIAELASGAGKALLVEKPLAVSVADGRAIAAAVERAGVPAMVAHTLRFDAVVRAVGAELPRLGRLHQICLSQRFEPSRLDWLDDRAAAGGGNVLHTGVHGFDLLRHLSGEDPRTALALTRSVVTRETEDNFAALFSFPGALVASVAGSRASAARSGAIEIAGVHGQIVADHVHGFAYRLIGNERRALDVGPREPTVRETLRVFVRLLRGEAPLAITIADGLWAVAMAEACYRSAESGCAEPVAS